MSPPSKATPEAYLKCLVVKQLLGLQSSFRLGDFVRTLEDEARRYDLIYASGVLYHMPDPLHLLRLIAERTDRAYVWTHFQDPHHAFGRAPSAVVREGLAATYYRSDNPGRGQNRRWWGGWTTALAGWSRMRSWPPAGRSDLRRWRCCGGMRQRRRRLGISPFSAFAEVHRNHSSGSIAPMEWPGVG